MAGMEIGVYTFGDLTPHPRTGERASAQQRLHEIIAAAKLADDVGLDVFGVGEHHRMDFAVSATPVVLAAIAQATTRIRLASAVTILSTADPVRVFEDFSTVDLLSGGRAEIIAGRGAFVESFPLFGYRLEDYHELFAEKLDLLLRLNESERADHRGRFRPPLANAEVAPRPAQGQLPVWLGVGGTPESAVRAGALGLPMHMAILGGPARFASLVELYRHAGAEAGRDLGMLAVGVASHGFLQKNSQQARDELFPHYASYFRHSTPNRDRGWQISRPDFEQNAGPQGALFVGSPQEVIDKILYQRELFGHQRCIVQLDIGGLPYAKVAEAIELLGSEVAPVVRRETTSTRVGAAPA
jgi:probable LLM family oxidoreductase